MGLVWLALAWVLISVPAAVALGYFIRIGDGR